MTKKEACFSRIPFADKLSQNFFFGYD